MKQKLAAFIKKNDLQFDGKEGESSLNLSCTIISGYALFLGLKDTTIIKDAINTVIKSSSSYEKELERVFEYAKKKNYGNYWKTEEARNTYSF